jgi:CheY-like chemotaxis protein
MPRMDGEETFCALRAEAPDLPVIVSSGYGAQEVQQRFAGATGVSFVQKPYELVQLIEALRLAASGKPR